MSRSSWTPSPGDWVVNELVSHERSVGVVLRWDEDRAMPEIQYVLGYWSTWGPVGWPVGNWLTPAHSLRLATPAEIASAQLDQESGL